MDRIRVMQAFVQVVKEGSFSKAAESLNSSPQLVSKYVSQLEHHLGMRLFHRTTRQVQLTEGGLNYFKGCKQLLDDLDALENNLDDYQSEVRGTLRISAPMSFGMRHLAKALVEFQKLHSGIRIDLQLNDRKVDIIQEGFDLALRIGHLKDSSLIAKRLCSIRLVTCAAPAYLKQHGTPNTPEQLLEHRYLGYSYMSEDNYFSNDKKLSLLKISNSFESNNGDVLLEAALMGNGIIVPPTFIAHEALKKKQLKIILEGYEPKPLGLYAVYANKTLLTAKLRHFIDFASTYFQDPPYWDNF